MSRKVAFPFLVLPENAVNLGAWLLGDPGKPLDQVEDIFENWDYARDLQVANSLRIDWDQSADSLQLPKADLRLRLVLIAGTGAGTLPRRQQRLAEFIVDPAASEVQVSAVIPGHLLSGRLRLTALLTLEGPLGAGSMLSPKVRGSRLWRSYRDVLIEDGGDSRFPVETVSFAEAFRGRPQERSPWFLHWRPGWPNADFSASVRLYVNADLPEVCARFVAGDAPTLQAILGDVMSQMIEPTLDKEGDTSLHDCEEGSVGRQVQRWIAASFPGQEYLSIKALREQNPGAFRAAILASAEVGVGQ
ncbi:hypothetical protein CNR27_08745 [Luteimonas chenhongjianii]|uniref:Uncharacterized protein n=1 Tax=Luteimonas chenhongjianii TaxID=2006110 RepID=A0A290XEL2_9GAMM|nr:hypothetical protein [Luteimonas chenhongjianii]ATD67511.1 hypothetical protein CNR27_08745 [Luteimonas chenhongjianii]